MSPYIGHILKIVRSIRDEREPIMIDFLIRSSVCRGMLLEVDQFDIRVYEMSLQEDETLLSAIILMKIESQSRCHCL